MGLPDPRPPPFHVPSQRDDWSEMVPLIRAKRKAPVLPPPPPPPPPVERRPDVTMLLVAGGLAGLGMTLVHFIDD